MDPNPPFEEAYRDLFKEEESEGDNVAAAATESCELPLVDLRRLHGGEREECRKEIVAAATEWGFFQVVNHGVPSAVLDRMREEQVRLFREPFWKKQNDAFMSMSPGCYRWGTPSATCLRQLAWSEAFHIPLHHVSSAGHASLSSTVTKFATTVSGLGMQLASILIENLGQEPSFFSENCLPRTCYLRMNRYPPCPKFSHVFGLMPHTDSDFLTILHQDQVGGLQLVKDGTWIAVNPNPHALIINIGDLFQAWSNDVYKSVEHRVVANKKVERFSTAYFLCPSQDAMIRSCRDPPVYRKFSFGEYRQQVQDDVKTFGHKKGLSQFLACSS
ncbi:hypothetical protein V2J09_006312 [Rumex salicifolius]